MEKKEERGRERKKERGACRRSKESGGPNSSPLLSFHSYLASMRHQVPRPEEVEGRVPIAQGHGGEGGHIGGGGKKE